MGMDFTGERFVPELKSGKISYEHWHRYIFATSFCTQKKVLDVASGEGYGSYHLSKVADTVVGVDIDDEVISYSKKTYTKNNLKFVKSDASKLPFDNDFFDVVVSFETLEHLNEENQRKFISEVKRVLREDGILLISTPNKKVYSDDSAYANPFHLKEFYEKEFKTFLQGYFEKVELFHQQIICGSVILQKAKCELNADYIRLSEEGYKPATNKAIQDMEYMIAICSNAELKINNGKGSLLLDEENSLYKEKFD